MQDTREQWSLEPRNQKRVGKERAHVRHHISMSGVRRASHSNSWYTGDKAALDQELSQWLAAVPNGEGVTFLPPIKGCKAIIAPHAGYSYSGPAAAWAYKSIDTTGIKRVFILGPSHHEYLNGCALSKQAEYATPIGNIKLDLTTIDELKETGKFTSMTLKVDEAEHSIEMHLPYIRKVFQGHDISIVPILVGAIDHDQEIEYGTLLSPFLARSDTICVVSTDFCHWGHRFRYTFYYPEPPPCNPIHLSRSNPSPPSLVTHPIHASISALDHEGLTILSLPSGEKASTSASDVHRNFTEYLARTKNTICGRHPIGVLLGALSAFDEDADHSTTLKFVRYEQSSACIDYSDSSVSYASAYVVF